MSEHLPAITLTSPRSSARLAAETKFRTAAPAQQTSERSNGARGRSRRGEKERPVTPVSRSGSRDDRPRSASGWASPARLRRSREPTPSDGAPRNNDDPSERDVQSPVSPMDPLSRHLLDRKSVILGVSTNGMLSSADGTSTNKDARSSSEQPRAPAVQTPPRRAENADVASTALKEMRKGVKAVSFISRLINNKRKDEEEDVEEETNSNEERPEGNDAKVFTDSADNIGFNFSRPQPPAYIKMRTRYKRKREFDHVFLAQELDARAGAKLVRRNTASKLRRRGTFDTEPDTVWAMKFSRCGKYLAAGGVDGILRVWAVLSSSEDRQKLESQETKESEAHGLDSHATHLKAPVFQSRPIREYEGHTGTILEISWSKNNFLLSSAMDKTVRLWHVTRAECLCTFQHNDIVPSIAFHPKDDRFFLAGCLDSKLRLWSIPEKSIAFTALVPEMITAVGFTPDGKSAMCGCLGGLCMFFETDGMKYQSQIHARSTRGQNSHGSKITGISAHNDSRGDVKLVITSNDSRVRLYNFRDKNLEMKFRGNENSCSQIRASVSDDARYIICGSEDRKAYIWSLGLAEGEKRNNRPLEMFEAHNTATTAACFAPKGTRVLLARSEDPVYDLCNPPPSSLLSRLHRTESHRSEKPSDAVSKSIPASPTDTEAGKDRAKHSPVQGNSVHNGGAIIVTADYTGKIKVFRQDCAWTKRKLDESDRASLLSKHTGKISRAGSMTTLASQRSTRDPVRNSIHGPSDRILSWRQGIVSTPNVADGQRQARQSISRSASPQKSILEHMHRNRRTEEAANQRDMAPPPPRQQPQLPILTLNGRSQSTSSPTVSETQAENASTSKTESPQTPATPKHDADDNPLMITNGRSFAFWNKEEWRRRAEQMHHVHAETLQALHRAQHSTSTIGEDGGLAVRPNVYSRGESFVSELSDERSSIDEFDDARETPGSPVQPHVQAQAQAYEHPVMPKCKVCRSAIFDVRTTAQGEQLAGCPGGCKGCGAKQ